MGFSKDLVKGEFNELRIRLRDSGFITYLFDNYANSKYLVYFEDGEGELKEFCSPENLKDVQHLVAVPNFDVRLRSGAEFNNFISEMEEVHKFMQECIQKLNTEKEGVNIR